MIRSLNRKRSTGCGKSKILDSKISALNDKLHRKIIDDLEKDTREYILKEKARALAGNMDPKSEDSRIAKISAPPDADTRGLQPQPASVTPPGASHDDGGLGSASEERGTVRSQCWASSWWFPAIATIGVVVTLVFLFIKRPGRKAGGNTVGGLLILLMAASASPQGLGEGPVAAGSDEEIEGLAREAGLHGELESQWKLLARQDSLKQGNGSREGCTVFSRIKNAMIKDLSAVQSADAPLNQKVYVASAIFDSARKALGIRMSDSELAQKACDIVESMRSLKSRHAGC